MPTSEELERIDWKSICQTLGYKSEFEMVKDLYLVLNKSTYDIAYIINLECYRTVSYSSVSNWIKKILKTKRLLPKYNLQAKYLWKMDAKTYLESKYYEFGNRRKLGDELGLTPEGVALNLKRLGIKMRPKGGCNNRKKSKQ